MARYLLDSNAFIRFENDPQALRSEAREAIEDATNELFLSLASLWELAVKAAKGKMPFFANLASRGPDAVARSLHEANFQLLPIRLAHTLASARLPHQHKDPFDRMVVAQAIEEDLVLITSDRTLLRYPRLRVLAA